MNPRRRPSDDIGERWWTGSEAATWCMPLIELWNGDANIRAEFDDIICFYDYAFTEVERLITSAIRT